MRTSREPPTKSFFQRRRNDNINKICVLEGVGEGNIYGKLSTNAVSLRKFHDSKMWKFCEFYCQKFCCHLGGSYFFSGLKVKIEFVKQDWTQRRHDRLYLHGPHPLKTMVWNHRLHPLTTMVLKSPPWHQAGEKNTRSGCRGGFQDHGSEGVQTMVPDHGFLFGNGPNTVSGSTVSNTELSEFFQGSLSSRERTQWVPLSQLFVCQNELTEFFAELTEFAPELSEAQWALFSETVLSKQYSARILVLRGWGPCKYRRSCRLRLWWTSQLKRDDYFSRFGPLGLNKKHASSCGEKPVWSFYGTPHPEIGLGLLLTPPQF